MHIASEIQNLEKTKVQCTWRFTRQFQNAERRPPEPENGIILATFGRFWVSFWIPLDFEGVPRSYRFVKNQHKMKKNDVQEGVLKKKDFQIDFDAKM